MRTYRTNDKVRIVTPDNKTLDGTIARVLEVYGTPEEPCFILDAPAAAFGRFRAHHTELKPEKAPRPAGYLPSGEFCKDCGSGSMVRSGTCLTCQNCGSTSGCS